MRKTWLLIAAVTIIGLFFRLWHIEFGLPHSFYADEPEIAELAIKYTYEFRNIISENNYYKLIPISYVYGTFPTYFLTATTMFFSKICNTLNISFDKTSLYVFMRVIISITSFLIVPVVSYLYYKIFKNKNEAILTFILLSLNWKLIVHAHYVNADILLTLLISLSFLTFYNYYTRKNETVYTILTAILLGLAAGTKITALLTLPLYMIMFVHKKEYKNLAAFLLIIIGTFIVTNPFSVIFRNDFVYRIFSMLTKEGGLVFDSVDKSIFKYVSGLSWMITPVVLLLSILGLYFAIKKGEEKKFNLFLIANVLTYFIFYSIQARRVDRWLLPILPVMIMYASHGFFTLIERTHYQKILFFISILGSVYYLYFPVLLLFQFQRFTPKAQSYLWAKENIPATSMVLGYTEEGLDPLNKLTSEKIYQFQVYESENAQFFLPENPEYYEYIILSSRVMENYKREEVVKKFSYYSQRWLMFENDVKNSGNYILEKSFVLPKPNLIPLSDVFIYRNLNPRPFL